jgi:hypothetical protein
MTTAKIVLVLLIAFAAVSTVGCAVQDKRDAVWDPKPGTTLFDQIPNWQGESQSRCCGHLTQCQVNQTPRC